MTEQPAVIIAGGRSTRFGTGDKAVAPLNGTPMIRVVADRLQPCIDGLVINCRDDQVDEMRSAFAGYPLTVQYRLDEIPDRGPIAGIATGLDAVSESTHAEYAFIVACDMPFVDPSIVEYLFQEIDGVDAVVPRLDDGWFQPMHAVYHADRMSEACNRALAAGRLRVIDPLEELTVKTVESNELAEVGNLQSFDNVNTKAKFFEAERELA